MNQFIGQTLGSHYQVTSILGQQSGRRTLLAENTKTQTLVVIKLVLFGPDFTWEDLKLFEREAETLKSLDHPAIPRYLDSFDVDTPLGKGFALVQTYIEAQSLEAWVSSGRRFQEADLQPIARALLSILYYLHSCYPAVVHRDIKPSNILLSKATSEQPAKLYLVDFGSVQTAKKDGTMTIVGTYGYMPPEQFSGRAKPASDLYSLGATLIYLATGKHPSELIQDNLTLEFSPHVRFSPSFIWWLTQITQPNISQRTASAQLALRQLTQSSAVRSHSQLKQQQPLSKHHSTAQPITAVKSSTVLTYGDFEVVSTSHELEIHCLHSRIQAPLRTKESFIGLVAYGVDGFTSMNPKLALMGIGLFMLLIVAFLVLFVIDQAISPYGSVSLFGWASLLIVPCAICILYIPMHWYPGLRSDSTNKTIFKISQNSGSLLLSLFTPQHHSTSEEDSSQETCHFSKVPLKQLQLKKALFGNRCRLAFSTLPGHHFGWLARKKLKLGTAFFSNRQSSLRTSQQALKKTAVIGELPAEMKLNYLASEKKANFVNEKKIVNYKTCAKEMVITGTPREMRWLARCISEWRNL